MRSLICFIITTFISLQFGHAGHLDQINVRALPQDENIVNNVSKMKELEPYVEHWVYEWNFRIGKDEVINQINALNVGWPTALLWDSKGFELHLVIGVL